MKINIRRKNIPLLATVCVFILIYCIGSFMYNGFFSLRVFINLFYDNAFLGIIAVGMTFVIISGGIDLSVGSMVAFTSIYMAQMIEKYHYHPFLVILITLTIGAIIGMTMGSLIHFFKLPAFLVTLSGMFLARGAAYMVSLDSIPITHPLLIRISTAGIPLFKGVNLPIVAIVFIFIVLLGAYLSHFTNFGRNTYAIGGSEQSALLMGLPVGRTKIMIYTLNSTLCALAGIIYSVYTLSGYAAAASGLELDVIASVVIGGTLLTGGIGYIEGNSCGSVDPRTDTKFY